MNTPTKIDASMLRDWLDCRELFRRRWLENIVPKKPAIHKEYGIAVHRGIEEFWRGHGYEQAFSAAIDYANGLDLTCLGAYERQRWDEMLGQLPDLLGAYFDEVSYEPQEMVEYEWEKHLVGGMNVSVCGRIDRFDGEVLYDVKTATEVGKDWRERFRQQMLRDIGLGLYDWYLVEIGKAPTSIVVEVIVKPKGDSNTRVQSIPLPEICSSGFRARFIQQLEWALRDMAWYLTQLSPMGVKPWPMNTNHACNTKYGPCDYLLLENEGENPRTLALYMPRVEHLEVRKSDATRIY